MRAKEIIRIVAITGVGAAVIFFVQPWLYRQGVIFLSDVTPEEWVVDAYVPASILVFGVSLTATCLWYGFAARAQPQRSGDTLIWRNLWWMLFLGPVLSVSGALVICRESRDALVSLTLMYVLDILLLYWIATASSSPGHTKYLPPGAFTIRQIFEPR